MDLVQEVGAVLQPPAEVSGVDAVLADVESLLAGARYLDAAEALTKALSGGSPSLALVRRLAWVERLQGHDSEALALLVAARRLSPDDVAVALDLAEVLRDLGRFGEALAVLTEAERSGRANGETADGRGRLYLTMGVPALAVEAFGHSAATTRQARFVRRRAWWRSGGPVGGLRRRRRRLDQESLQARLRVTPTLVDERLTTLESILDRVGEQVDKAQRVAAVRARSRGLLDGDRFAEVAGVLAEGLSSAGPHIELLRDLARTERMLGHHDVALAALTIAAELDGSDLWTKADLAETLVRLRRYRQAVALLSDMPAEPRQHWLIRWSLADAYQAMGLRAFAFDAYAGLRDLGRRRRRDRRRLWWQTGGPLRFVRSRQRTRDRGALRAWPEEVLPPGEPAGLAALLGWVCRLVEEDRRVNAVLGQAQRLMDDGDYVAAGEVLRADLAANPPTVAVLRKLSLIERSQNRQRAALASLVEARRIDPADLQLVGDQIGVLTDLSRVREALALLADLPQADRRQPDLRSVVGRLYRAMGLPALAVVAYGDRQTLSAGDRRDQRRVWWRSGGPLRLLRRRVRRFEENVLRNWRTFSRHLRLLDTLCWPPGFDPTEPRARLDWRLQQAELLWQRGWSSERWVGRGVQIVAAALAWFALLWVAGLAGLRSTWLAAGAAVAGTAVAFLLFRLVFFRFAIADSWHGSVVRGVPCGLALVGGGYGLTRLTEAAPGWPDLAGTVLVATAGMALSYITVMGPLVARHIVVVRRHWRDGPREDILDELLAVLDDLNDPAERNYLDQRAILIAQLERAATTVEKLPARLRMSDQVTATWAAERSKGAATALRLLKRQIAAPVAGTWDRVATVLRDEVVALATGDLGKLHWAAPPTPTAARRSRRDAAADVLRAVALAVAPLAAVLAVQPLLHLDTTALRWMKVAGFAWSVLYLYVAFDPTLREKIETAQQAANLLGTARRATAGPERRDAAASTGDRAG